MPFNLQKKNIGPGISFFYLVSPFKKAGKSQYNSLLLEALEVAPSYMERIQRRLKTQNRHE